MGIEILTSDKPTVTELKSRIKETELDMQNKGEPDKTEQTTCKICKGKSHKTEECWGECKICGRFGHKTEVCRHSQENVNTSKKKEYEKCHKRKSRTANQNR